MTVRKAVVTDVPALIEMGIAMTAESEVFRGMSPNFPRQQSVLHAAIQNPNVCVFVTDTLDGMFIGHVTRLDWFDDLIGQEDVLFVIPEVRGSRRASELVSEFLSWAKELGLKEVRASVNTMVNTESAVRFYEKKGFTKFGVNLRKEI